MRGMIKKLGFVCTIALLVSLLGAANAAAEENKEPDDEGLRAQTALQLRAVPIGLSFLSDVGYRVPLSDSDSTLLDGTYREIGITNNASPSYMWLGPYVQFLPLAVLELRGSVQYMGYFGTYGYLMTPEDQSDPDWSLDAIDRSDDLDLGVPSKGWQVSGSATGRLKVGNIVSLIPFEYHFVDMAIGETYYESTFDMLLEPTDSYWLLKPMAGYVFQMDSLDSYVLSAFRWEHGQTNRTDVTRDIAQLMGIWKMPGGWWDGHEMQLVVLGGYWVNHPNREGTLYLAGQFKVSWATP